MQAAVIARLHTLFAATAFLTAITVASALHFHKIVKNDVAGYPQEWFPSVSATIGDWYPERNIFQILIALTSGPRFVIVFLQYFLHHSSTSSLPTVVFLSGVLRTLSCGGWVYITSSDDHDIHDIMMILYMVCNIPWMLGSIATTPVASAQVRRKRKFIAAGFFMTIIPLIYFFVQHKVHRIPGAYTCYAFFEWGLIFFDVLYDSVSEQEFREVGLLITLTTPNNENDKRSTEIIHVKISENKQSSNEAVVINERKSLTSLKDSIIHPVLDKAMADAVDLALSSPHSKIPQRRILSSRSRFITLASDVYLSYIFWSMFTSLIPTLFYFSVWKLGIAGHELALLSVLSPILLPLSSPYNYIFSSSGVAPPSLLTFISTRHGQVILHITSLIGVIAYLVPSPGGRLLFVSIANIIAVMRQVVSWVGIVGHENDVSYQAIVTGLGIITASLSKQANRANNPVWPFVDGKAGGYNKTGIFLAILAIYEYATRPQIATAARTPSSSSYQRSPWLAALPIGSLLFCLHNFLSDSSTLIAWSWTGYENHLPRGPVPHIHGSLTITAMAFGLLAALWSLGITEGIDKAKGNQPEINNPLSHPLWFAFGASGAYIMYAYRNWTGYAGGLCLAAFLMSILPQVFQIASWAAVGNKPSAVAKTYTIAMVVYCLLNLASIFTAAYAFVPGGVYLRERTDLVTIVQMACLLPAFKWHVSPSTPMTSASSSPATFKSYVRSLLFIFPLLSLFTTLYRLPRSPPYPFKPGPRIINAGIWTVHFGIDNEGHDSQGGMRNLIRDMELDIVGLLETDLHRTAFGHRDLTRLLVEDMNYNVDIGPGPNSHTWGAVLLSKFPIISTKHHLLPSPQGELAPAIEAILDVYGTEVLVLVSHNGQEEDALDRELQSTELAKIMAASHRPVIFLGYVVTKPGMPRPHPYGIIVDEGNVHDIDADDSDRWCEYIFYRGLYRTSYARISRGIITDTETQVAQFVLPRHGQQVINDTLPARYLRSRKEELPAEHWFPTEYYGNAHQGGVDGHYYHVFNTPLYYRIPEDTLV